MKVIQIIDSLNVGGAEVLAVNIANALSDRNIESHICVSRKEGDLKDTINNSVGYLFLNRKKTIDFSAILKLKTYINKNNIQVIHAHSTSSFLAFCIKIVCPKVKVIWHNHSGNYIHLKGKKLKALKLISKKINYIISVNKELENWAKTTLKHKNGSYVPNFPVFTNKGHSTKLKGIDNKKIVSLAGLRSVKDHFTLLQAFLLLQKKFPEWTLHLIGKDYQDTYSRKIKAFIVENNLVESVFLYNVQSDIEYILSQATIGVLSSEYEGLPIALLEYGLAGLPIVVTDVGQCKQLINNSNAVVKSKDSISFANALENIILNEDIREKIKNDLQFVVKENFSKEAIVPQFIKIYKKLC